MQLTFNLRKLMLVIWTENPFNKISNNAITIPINNLMDF